MRFGKKGMDLGLAYIIMIALGILGIILVIWILQGGFGPISDKLLGIMNQSAP